MRTNEARFLRIVLNIVVLVIGHTAVGQSESNIWYFGDHAGLDFSDRENPIVLTHKSFFQHEGCATISDCEGKLLFSTNGVAIWDKNNDTMANGNDLGGNNSTTQSSLIVRLPGSNHEYFVFTIDDIELSKDLRYSIVDMSLNNGLGSVTQNKNVFVHSPVAEKLVAVGHQNGKDIWIITHEWESDAFLSYLLTETGLAASPIVSNTGTIHSGGNWHNLTNGCGYLKASPKQNKIALAIRDLYCELFDFDNTTGIVSNPITFDIGPMNYGLEFSPDGSILYTSDARSGIGNIYQYDLSGTPSSILNSKTLIGTSGNQNGALQLAPNGKIYIAQTYKEHLSTINKPNILGLGCEFDSAGISISPNISHMGLPNFIIAHDVLPKLDLGNDTTLCAGSSLVLDATTTNTTYLWSDGSELPTLEILESGVFWVKQTNNFCSVITDTIEVNFTQKPIVHLGNDTTICVNDTLSLELSLDDVTYLWSDFSFDNFCLVTKPGIYWVEVNNSCGMVTDEIVVQFEKCGCEVYFPTAFSPDGDLLNDIFLPIADCNFTLYDFTIFDRWGQKIFETKNPMVGWNGNFGNNKAPCGVYIYRFNYKSFDSEVKITTGSVTLIR